MIEFERDFLENHERVKRKCIAYTQEEADEKGLQYVYWKDVDADNPEEYALTDDGYVSKVTRVSQYETQSGNKIKKLIKLEGGQNFNYKTSEIKFLDNHAYHTYSKIKPDHWVNSLVKKESTKRVIYLYAKMLLSGDIDWNLLAKHYKPNDKIPIASVKLLLRQKKVKHMVDDEINEILERQGLTGDFVVSKLRMTIERAFEKEDSKNVISGIALASKWLKMEGTKQKETNQIEASYRTEIEGKIAEEKKLKMSQTKEGVANGSITEGYREDGEGAGDSD